MIGWRFMRVEPTEYLMQYRKGRLVRQGSGLSFFYFAPTSSLILIPLTSTEVPFTFQEMTSDYQQVTISGQITYRVSDPIKLSQLLDFTLLTKSRSYKSDDPKKLFKRVINHAQVVARSCIRTMTLHQVLGDTDNLADLFCRHLENARVIGSLGIEILDLAIFTLKPAQEILQALEADTREQIRQKADRAIYARRRSAIEQERTIKASNLNTQIIMERKKQQVGEARLEVLKSLLQKKRELKEAQMVNRIALEKKTQELVSLAVRNRKLEADAKAYDIAASMKALAVSDPRVIQSLTCTGMDSGKLVALAFKELAERTEKINQLNLSSDILRELIPKNGDNK